MRLPAVPLKTYQRSELLNVLDLPLESHRDVSVSTLSSLRHASLRAITPSSDVGHSSGGVLGDGGGEGRGGGGGGTEGGAGASGGSGGLGGTSGCADVQYAEWHTDSCGSLYRYVVVVPPSYEHAHTRTVVCAYRTSWPWPLYDRLTVPTDDGSPASGCGVDSQADKLVWHLRPFRLGGVLDRRKPAEPTKRYHDASATVLCDAMGERCPLDSRSHLYGCALSC